MNRGRELAQLLRKRYFLGRNIGVLYHTDQTGNLIIDFSDEYAGYGININWVYSMLAEENTPFILDSRRSIVGLLETAKGRAWVKGDISNVQGNSVISHLAKLKTRNDIKCFITDVPPTDADILLSGILLGATVISRQDSAKGVIIIRISKQFSKIVLFFIQNFINYDLTKHEDGITQYFVGYDLKNPTNFIGIVKNALSSGNEPVPKQSVFNDEILVSFMKM